MKWAFTITVVKKTNKQNRHSNKKNKKVGIQIQSQTLKLNKIKY